MSEVIKEVEAVEEVVTETVEEKVLDKGELYKTVGKELSEEFIKEEVGHKVKIGDFGTLTKQLKAAREGVNPRTGEKIHITEKKYVSFKMGNKLKKALN